MTAFILASYGLSNILVSAKIASRYRAFMDILHPALGELAKCMMCTAFWVGLLLSGMTEEFLLVDGFIASGSSWIIHVVVQRLGGDEL